MNKYLKNLRKLVGHMPILVCGAGVIVENEKGEILLQQRSDNKLWGFPGGIVDINEVVEDAAKRELLEETGIIANSLELFGVFSGKELYHIYPNGDEISVVDIIYTCTDYTGDPKADFIESIDAKFFPPDKLPNNMSAICTPVLEKYKGRRRRNERLS